MGTLSPLQRKVGRLLTTGLCASGRQKLRSKLNWRNSDK